MPHDPSDDDHKAALRSQIDENLRRIYHTALEDAVPERFTRLLQQLRDASSTPSSAEDTSAPSPQDPVAESTLGTGSRP
jgi:hypothetical protein